MPKIKHKIKLIKKRCKSPPPEQSRVLTPNSNKHDMATKVWTVKLGNTVGKQLCIESDKLLITGGSGGSSNTRGRVEIPLFEVVGASLAAEGPSGNPGKHPGELYTVDVIWYELPENPKKKLGRGQREMKTLQVKATDEAGAMEIVTSIREAVYGGEGAGKVLLYLNPVSGTKRGRKIWSHTVKWLLEAAGMEYDYVETTGPKFVREDLKTRELNGISAIGIMSGDGVLGDVANGLVAREDWNDVRKIPLALIPVGSGNGAGACVQVLSVEDGVFTLLKGTSVPLDAVRSESASGGVEWWVLSATHAIISDCDIRSEVFRMVGEARVYIWAVWAIIVKRGYKFNKIWVRTKSEKDPPAHADAPRCTVDMTGACDYCLDDEGEIVSGPNGEAPGARERDVLAAETVPEGWVAADTSENLFYMTVTSLPWLAQNFLACNRSHLATGTVEVGLITNSSRWTALKCLLKTDSGDHLDMPEAVTLSGSAVLLEPADDKGLTVVDGELRSNEKVLHESWPGMFSLKTVPGLGGKQEA